MLPNFLLEETEIRKDGEGPAVPVDGGGLQLTLGITEIVEQQSLDVSIFGSPDGTIWTPKPIVQFPTKFYKGVSTILLDLAAIPEVHYLKVKYKAVRWGHWTDGPRFTFYVFAEPLQI